MRALIRGLIVLVAWLATPAAAFGQDVPPATSATPLVSGATSPSRYTERNLTGPAGKFTLVAGPLSNLDLTGGILEAGMNQVFIKDIEFCFLNSCTEVEIDDPLFAVIGASYGITDDAEVGALLVNLQLSPDFEYEDPALWGRYRFLTGNIEIAAQLMVWIPISRPDLGVELGVPVRLHGPVRFDTGIYLAFEPDGDFGMRVPATVTTNITEAIFLGGRSGITIPQFNSEGVAIPLEFVAGYTIADAGTPLADITLMAGFPFFIVSGGRGQYDELVTEIFHVAIGANVFFDI